jgi:chromosome partitioning protein
MIVDGIVGMTVKIAVANQKGGVGKTDLCVNLASCLSKLGRKVLLLDIDPQANSTDYLTSVNPKVTVRDLLMKDDVNVDDVILKTDFENMYLIPSEQALSVAQVQLANEVNMQFRLKRRLKGLGDDYDYIFIDTPPSLGLLTVNALTVADQVLIPIQTHYFAMDGVAKLQDTVNTIKEDLNPNLKIGGIVLTMYDRRTSLSKEVEQNVRKAFRGRVFETVIPTNVKLAESPSYHKPILEYSPSSTGAKAYMDLAREFLS